MKPDHVHGQDPETGVWCDKRDQSCYTVGRLCGSRHPEYQGERLVTCARIAGHCPDHHRGWSPSMHLIDWNAA